MTNIPELEAIDALFEKSKYGIVFTGKTKNVVGERLKKLHLLSPFDFFMESIQILKELAGSTDYFLLHDYPFVNKYRKKEQDRLRSIHGFVDQHYQRKISVAEVADLCNLGKEAFCRYFKKTTGKHLYQLLESVPYQSGQKVIAYGQKCK